MVANVEPKTRVAIIGGGPCGTTLGTLLAEKGIDVTLFSDGKRPDLVVGESLIPALIPMFREMGIEEEIAAIGQKKPGATFRFDAENDFELSFDAVEGMLPTYAYNVPRREFDEILEKRAEKAGIRKITARAQLQRGSDTSREVELAEETRSLVPEWKGEHPDLIIDASGRTRVVSKLLEIPADIGSRKDIAYFAHYDDFEEEGPKGQILISRLQPSGWSWRIPLPGKMSVGVVLNKEIAKDLGNTPEERLEAAIERDVDLAARGKNRKRLTDVPVYTNYQLVSKRGFGPGWVAAGDAYGFVDPMLSPGLFLGMWSARLITEIVPVRPAQNLQSAFTRYEKQMFHMIDSWQRLIDAFYDGSVFSVYKTGNEMSMKYPDHWISDRIESHISRNMAGMACGCLTDSRYSQGLLKFLCRYGIRGFDPADLAIS